MFPVSVKMIQSNLKPMKYQTVYVIRNDGFGANQEIKIILKNTQKTLSYELNI